MVPLSWYRLVLSCLVLTILSPVFSGGSYLLTVPRRWSAGTNTQVCTFMKGERKEEDTIIVQIRQRDDTNKVYLKRILDVPTANSHHCENILVPTSIRTLYPEIEVSGVIGGEKIHHTEPITIAEEAGKTYVQTDKYLYKPNQLVQFRMLTLRGPFMEVSRDDYEEVYIENPSTVRIAQWKNVSNVDGLIHLSMKLTEEPEEGTYNIKVKTPYGEMVSQPFKVEEYVLPRYEVTVTTPPYILGTAKKFNFTVCGKYTFGQPVKGKVLITVNNNGWGHHRAEVTKEEKISGCKDIEFTADELNVTVATFTAYSLHAAAKIIEEGTDVELSANDVSVSVTRTAIHFQAIAYEDYRKPELPYTGKVKATFPDDTPAANEPMEVCINAVCQNIATDSEGILTFLIPPHIEGNPQIKAVNYPRIKMDDSWRSIMYESSHYIHLKKYHSPSNSSLIIALPEEKLKCRTEKTIDLDIPLMFAAANQSKALITVQVVSRGQIQYLNTAEYELVPGDIQIDEETLVEPMQEPASPFTVRGTLSIPVQLPRTISPSPKILVWYSRDDGEVVSDVRQVDVKKCLDNKVKLQWSAVKVQPGDEATLSIMAEPNSVCSLGVVDKSVELLSESKPLSVGKIFQMIESTEVNTWENRQINDYEYCTKKVPLPPIDEPIPRPIPLAPAGAAEEALNDSPVADEPAITGVSDDATTTEGTDEVKVPVDEKDSAQRPKRSSPYYWGPYTEDADALYIFDQSGLFVFSDLTLETRPCKGRHHGTSPDHRPFGFGGGGAGGGGLAVIPTAGAPPSIQEHVLVQSRPEVEEAKEEIAEESRTHFPETWLWHLMAIQENGEKLEHLTLPDTITEWVGRAVCVHPHKGVGLSSRAPITTFTPFFVDLTLPPTVKRGEILPVKISVFNYMHESLPVKVILESSSEYDILGENGSEPLTDQSEGGVRSSCIIAQDKVVHTIRIAPKIIGDMNITVGAFVDDAYPEACGPEILLSRRDSLVKPIKVEAEGFPREKTWTKYMCPKDFENNEDYFDRWRVETPFGIVEQSERGWITAAGDLLGPTLENLGNLVRMPYGCGEQNMLNFAPNIFVMQYLDASKQTTKEISEKAIHFMERGYQRELNYRRKSGSFSAFGNSDDSGSTWLTGFVIKSFAQARQYIKIDANDLEFSKGWLKSKQLENGKFESVGKVLHKGMKGGISGDESPVLLTSYIMIALLEASEPITSKAITDALSFITKGGTTTPYGLALKAYALALAKHPDAETVLTELLSMAVSDKASLYWDIKSNGKTSPVAVETAGYALLAMLAFNPEKYAKESLNIIKWISSQRNGQGGFISTQDTVVALQALAAYESLQSHEPVDLLVMVNGDSLEHTFKITEDNKLLQQMVSIPVIPTNIRIDIVGSGCALVQAALRYNVPDPTPSEVFKLEVETETASDQLCKTKRIKVCASYLNPDEVSNMGVIEINLVSGYIPEKADLKQVVGYGTGLFKRYEVDGSKVTLYIDQFSNKNICASFRTIREVDVEDPKPGTVRVYDYYEPEFSVNKDYNLPPNDECFVDDTFPFRPVEIIEPIDYEEFAAEENATTIRGPAPEDVAGLVDALESL